MSDTQLRVLADPGPGSRQRNPYVRLLYQHLIDLGVTVDDFSERGETQGYDLLHVHWPESHLNTRNPVKAALRSRHSLRGIDELRSEGVKVVWTIHNLHSHERFHPRLEPRFWRAFAGRVDGLIAMSDYGLAAARSSFPALGDVPGFVVPHGHYMDAYPNAITPMEARRRLHIPESSTTAAFVGSIRRYKGIDRLLRIFKEIRSEDIVLLVAGRPNLSSLRDDILDLAAGDGRIRCCLRELSPTEVDLYLKAADLVVLPYLEVLNSGAALLALSFARPVLAPARGALPELRGEIGEDWVMTYAGELDRETFARALDWAHRATRGPAPNLEQRDWQRVAALTMDAYVGILGTDTAGERRTSP